MLKMTRVVAALAVISVCPTAARGQTIIDTFPDWTGSITSGWAATAQTITAPAVDNVLTDYRFELAPRPSDAPASFTVYAWGTSGPILPPLYTTNFTWPAAGGVIDITGINATLTPGAVYGLSVDFLGYTGQSVHFNGNRTSYTGGNGWWTTDPSGAWVKFSGLNHKFRAVLTGGYSCEGDQFQDPFASVLELTAKNNKTIPVKMMLFDSTGNPITDAVIATPPVINVMFSPAIVGGAVDLTDALLPQGSANDGNSFRWDPLEGRWIYNLGTKQFPSAGTYTVSAAAGDGTYAIKQNSCSEQFIRLGN